MMPEGPGEHIVSMRLVRRVASGFIVISPYSGEDKADLEHCSAFWRHAKHEQDGGKSVVAGDHIALAQLKDHSLNGHDPVSVVTEKMGLKLLLPERWACAGQSRSTCSHRTTL